MKRNVKMTLSAVIFAGLVIVPFCLNHSVTSQSPAAAAVKVEDTE